MRGSINNHEKELRRLDDDNQRLQSQLTDLRNKIEEIQKGQGQTFKDWSILVKNLEDSGAKTPEGPFHNTYGYGEE